MHNATGRHLVADRQLSTTHTQTFTVCVMVLSFFLHNPSLLCKPPAQKFFTPEWCGSIFLTHSLSYLEWGK